ncbi:MAG: S9 family peptidase, partial [Bacteroidota bacterium]
MRKITYLCFMQALIFGALLVPADPLFAKKKEGVKVTDLLKIKSISDVALSKDGRLAVFTVTVIEPDPELKLDYKYVNHLYLVPSDGSASPRELTVKESS